MSHDPIPTGTPASSARRAAVVALVLLVAAAVVSGLAVLLLGHQRVSPTGRPAALATTGRTTGPEVTTSASPSTTGTGSTGSGSGGSGSGGSGSGGSGSGGSGSGGSGSGGSSGGGSHSGSGSSGSGDAADHSQHGLRVSLDGDPMSYVGPCGGGVTVPVTATLEVSDGPVAHVGVVFAYDVGTAQIDTTSFAGTGPQRTTVTTRFAPTASGTGWVQVDASVDGRSDHTSNQLPIVVTCTAPRVVLTGSRTLCETDDVQVDGFAPGERVVFSGAGLRFGSTSVTADGSGHAATTVEPRLSGTSTVAATGAASRATGTATLTVASPTVSLEHDIVLVGSTVFAHGNGFCAGDAFTVRLAGSFASTTTGDVLPDGSVEGSVIVPMTAGRYGVQITDDTTGETVMTSVWVRD